MSINTLSNISDTVYTKNTAAANNQASSVDSAASSGAASSDVKGTESTTTESTTKQDDTAAVYDKRKLSEDDRKAIVEQLKADQEKRQAQLTELVHNMLSTQTDNFGKANNIWRFLASGKFTVDADTQKKAQEAISEDGYWGVKQTSDRIVQFATALAGDDSKALEKMRDAFIKGYKQAEKTWGGKLPDISQKTYDAVIEKLDKLSASKSESGKDNSADNSSNNSTTTEDGTVVVKD